MLIHSNVYHHRNTWLHDPYTHSHAIIAPTQTLQKPHILQAKTVILHHHSTNTTPHSIYLLLHTWNSLFLFSAELYMEFTYPHMFQHKPKLCETVTVCI